MNTATVLRQRAVSTSLVALAVLIVCALVREGGLPAPVWVVWGLLAGWSLSEASIAARRTRRTTTAR